MCTCSSIHAIYIYSWGFCTSVLHRVTHFVRSLGGASFVTSVVPGRGDRRRQALSNVWTPLHSLTWSALIFNILTTERRNRSESKRQKNFQFQSTSSTCTCSYIVPSGKCSFPWGCPPVFPAPRGVPREDADPTFFLLVLIWEYSFNISDSFFSSFSSVPEGDWTLSAWSSLILPSVEVTWSTQIQVFVATPVHVQYV